MVDSKVRRRRWIAAAIVLLLAVGVGTAAVVARSDNGAVEPPGTIGRGPSVSLAVAASGRVGVVSGDDEHILAQGELPPVARVDYASFPRGDPPASSSGRTWYVATTGDDRAPGTPDRTLRTIEAALRQAADGDTVYVRAGTYASTGLRITRSLFLLAAYPGETVTVVPDEAGGDTGLVIATPSQHDVTVRGLRIEGFADAGIRVGNPQTVRRVVLEDLMVSGSQNGFVGDSPRGMTGVDGLLVRGTTLRGIGLVGFRFGEGAVRDARITGLHVQMASSTSATSTGSGGDALAIEAGDNILVENSILEEAAADGVDLNATRAAIVNTVVRHVGHTGIKLGAGGDVINCIVYDTGADAQLVTAGGRYRILDSTFAYHRQEGGRFSYAATFGYPAASGDVLIANSVFSAEPGPMLVSPAMGLQVEHCVFYGFPERIVDYSGRSLGEATLEAGLGTGNRVIDPGFVAPESGDFHPDPHSPLLGAGTPGLGAPAFDLVLEARDPAAHTVGAYQATGTPTTAFVDVPFDHPYREAIVALADARVVSGYSGPRGTLQFEPDEPVRRAQFAKMICGVLNIPVTEDLTAPFADLGHDDTKLLYPHDYVAAAAAAGIARGLDPGVFGPWEDVTRAQVITMIVRGAESLAPGALEPAPAGFAGTLGDFSADHAGPMRVAERNGLLSHLEGFGEGWNPWAPATRGEVAAMLFALSARL